MFIWVSFHLVGDATFGHVDPGSVVELCKSFDVAYGLDRTENFPPSIERSQVCLKE